MATTRPFAYNTGTTVPSTTQLGDLGIGVDAVDYGANPGGLQWWMGPDEDLGYVIAHTTPDGNQPNPVLANAYVGFWRSEFLTEQSFINLCNSIPPRQGQAPFTSGEEAKTWLNNNGYWTSYISITPTPTQTPTNTATQTPTLTPTNTATVTPTISNTPTQTQTNTASVTPTISNTPTLTPTNTATVTPTISNSPTQTPTITPTITATNTPTQTPTNTSTNTPTNTQTPSNTPNVQGFTYSNFASTTGLTLLGNASVSSNIINLTTATNSQVGNVYRTSAIRYDRNFSAQWSTFIGGGTGADGFCIQWTSTNNSTGGLGGAVGLIQAVGTINAITFLTYTNNSYNWYKNNVLQSANSVSSGLWRQTLYFWGDYNHSAQTFALYWNTTNTKPGSANKTFTSFTFDTGSYYMGFGAATGGLNDAHQLLNWILTFT